MTAMVQPNFSVYLILFWEKMYICFITCIAFSSYNCKEFYVILIKLFMSRGEQLNKRHYIQIFKTLLYSTSKVYALI